MNTLSGQFKQAGVTLIELVISIVIISIAIVGILGVMTLTTSHSADPMIRHQAISIAQAYMEEIQLHSYCDPDTGACGCSGLYEASRDLYDNICDYNDPSLPTNIRDQDNIVINELNGYTVGVSVAATLFEGIPSSHSLKIDVQVTHAAGLVDFTLTSFRSRY
ncbi:MAG: DUF4242 domain-containing protein [Gammaproteobacteria bacterium]|nr:DUF4242 domain-containing protein [Gammaproteobacteria bacterium]